MYKMVHVQRRCHENMVLAGELFGGSREIQYQRAILRSGCPVPLKQLGLGVEGFKISLIIKEVRVMHTEPTLVIFSPQIFLLSTGSESLSPMILSN